MNCLGAIVAGFLAAFLAGCSGNIDQSLPTGEGEPVESVTSALYRISFNTAPGGLPQIDCTGSDPPNTWSYYGSFCSGEDGIRSRQLFWAYGRGDAQYEEDGCVCVRVLDPSYKCWITTGSGPDLNRDKIKMRQARSTIALTASNWIHRDARNYETECAVSVMRCQANVGCPSTPIAF